MTPERGQWQTMADRCEAATGPDSRLEAEIDWTMRDVVGKHYTTQTLNGETYSVSGWWRDANSDSHRAPPYTASLDAALTLVPEDGWWRLGHDGDGADPSDFRAEVIVPGLLTDARGKAVASTPALALCAAVSRAKAILTGTVETSSARFMSSAVRQDLPTLPLQTIDEGGGE